MPEISQCLTRFYAMTAVWLTQVNLDVNLEEGTTPQNFIPKQYVSVTFPLPEAVPTTLRYVEYTIYDELQRMILES